LFAGFAGAGEEVEGEEFHFSGGVASCSGCGRVWRFGGSVVRVAWIVDEGACLVCDEEVVWMAVGWWMVEQ
jgi:hypothetical protein